MWDLIITLATVGILGAIGALGTANYFSMFLFLVYAKGRKFQIARVEIFYGEF